MKLLSRYVLFYCDDCTLLTPAITAFTSVHKFHTVLTSSSEVDFFEKLEKYEPELLLVYFRDTDKHYMSLVRAIRESSKWSAIPLIVYKQLPESQEMVDAFGKLNFTD